MTIASSTSSGASRGISDGVRYENIPDELKEHDRWVCWRTKHRDGKPTKIPVDARTGGSAKSNDEETWASFEAARNHYEAHEEVEGIGFVFSRDGRYAGVDLDDCVDPETREVDDRARDIVERLDSYTEFSPSGTGLHVIVEGLVPPDGNRSGDVEMYDERRFFTFTGDVGMGGPRSVEKRVGALREVHADYVRNDEGDEDTADGAHDGVNSEPADVALEDEELLRKARNAENGDKFDSLWNGDTSGYPSHSEADEALCCLLAFWTGGNRQRIDELFRRSGLMRPKWDEDRGDKTYGELTIEKAVEYVDEYYDPDSNMPEMPEALGEHEGGVDLVERNGGYGYLEYDDEGKAHFDEVSNFTIETDALIEHAESGERRFKLTVNPRDGEPYQVDVEPKVFNSKTEFESQVVTGFTTRFDGGKQARNDLRELVGNQEADVLEGKSLMEVHGGELATPAGTLFGDGWKENPEAVFIERGTDIERRWSLSPDDDVEKDDVDEILRLLPKIRNPDRFLTALGWFYAAPLKPKFLDWIGEFPLLSVTGDTGSGKTSTLQVLWRAFGMDEDPLSVDTTPHAQLTQFASSGSVPVWFDEYRPSNINDRRVDQFHDYCRKTTRGGSESKGNPDGTTTTYRIKAPVVVSGEQRFQDPSLVRRSVLTNFRTDATDEGTETQRAYARLTGESYEDEDGSFRYPERKDLTSHAFEYYTWLLGQDEDELRELWRGCREDLRDVLERNGVSGLGGTERESLRVSLFGLRLYQSFAQERGVEVPISPDEVGEGTESALVHAARNVGDGDGERRSHLDEFVEMVGRAAMEGYLEEGEHYKLMETKNVVRFNLSRCYDKVRKYHSDHGLSSALFERNEYLSRLKDAEGEVDYVEKVQQNTPPINRATGVYLDEAEEAVEIQHSMFEEGEAEGPR
jgi:primase-polymerase (primpol)-like protein